MIKENNIVGLKRGTVKLKKHNPDWIKLFQKEKKLLLKEFPGIILEIKHGGSTAISNMPAKPIIDIFAAVSSLQKVKNSAIKKSFEKLGYEYRGGAGVRGRILYTKGRKEIRTHHLHFLRKNSDEWKKQILIKERLLKNLGAAQKYAKLKRTLAKKYPDDRKAYTHGKDSFLKLIIKDVK